jgi:RHS repeat-associated protein
MQSNTFRASSHSHVFRIRKASLGNMFLALVAGLASLLSGGTSFAQTVNLGDDVSRPIPGSGHDYIHLLSETVSPSNGNVEIKIQFPTAPGRGISLPFGIMYDSGEVHRFGSNYPGCGGFDGACINASPGMDRAQTGYGWSDTLPYVSVSLQNVAVSGAPYYGAILWCPLSSSYNFYDAEGGSHMLGLAALGQGYPVPGTVAVPSGCSRVPYGTSGYYYFYSRTGGDDQVLAQMDATCDGNYVGVGYPTDCDNGLPAFTVTDVKGTTYTFPANGATGPEGGPSNSTPQASWVANIFPSKIEDRNGNVVNFTVPSNSTSPALPVTDSLGRPHISLTNNANGSGTYTVDGLQYTVGYTTMNADYTIGAQQVANSQNATCGLTKTVTDSSLPVIQTISLPNGHAYTFKYDSTYGTVKEIDYPDGGWVQYTWGLTQTYSTLASYDGFTSSGGVASGGCNMEYQTPAILTRTVGYTATGGAKQIQNFSYNTLWNNTNGQWTSKTTTVTTHDVQTGQSATTTYTYTPVYQPLQPDAGGQMPAELPVESVVTQTDWGSSAPLSQTTKAWVDQFEMTSEATVLNGITALTSKKVYCYYYANCAEASGYPQQLQSLSEYDFGQSSPTRQTTYTYYAFTPPCLMLSDQSTPSPCQSWTPKSTGFAPTQIVTKDGSGNRLAETDAYYDGMTPTSNTVVPVSLNDVTGLAATIHDETNYAQSSTQARSNLTEVIKWSNAGGSPTTALGYDKTGQIRTKTDPCVVAGCSDMAGTTGGNYWAYSYADQWSSGTSPTPTNAYLTQVTDPLGHLTKYKYAWSDGQLANVTDSNSKTTTYQYNDSLRRMTNVGLPDGGATTIIYTDSVPSVETDKLLNSPGTLVKNVDTYDGMGHVLNSSSTSDPFGPTSITMTYNGMGEVFTKTNPKRSAPSTSDGNSTYYYDALGRPVETIEQDGTSISTWCYDGAISSPVIANCATSSRLGSVANGTWVDSWDQLGNHSQHVSDSFGRLTEVMEPNGTAQTPTMETDYTYDLLNNLKSVTQWGGSSGSSGARTRSFNYDSLSRLSAASNPESGTVNYVYDLNGNLNYKTSPAVDVLSTSPAQTQTISYCYDVLNRLSYRFYSGGVSCSAPANYVAAYSYDTATGGVNTVGRLTSATSYSGTTLVAQRITPAYDAMGRLQNETQCTLVNCAGTRYAPSYTYDYLGDILTAAPGLLSTVPVLGTTPLQITSQFDAAGRLEEVTSNVPDAANSNYPSTLFLAESTSPAAYGPVGLAFASIGIDQNTSLAVANTSRAYDNKARPASEIDASNATGNFGIIKITGAEQSTVTSANPGTPGQAIIQIGGGGQPYSNPNANAYIYVNSVMAYATFPGSISTTYVAQQIANAINATGGMPATAQAEGPNVIIQAKTVGTATDYSLQLTANGISYPLTVPSSLTGGTNSSPGGTVYDSGTVNATLGGVTASYAWGSSDTPTTMSAGLAAAMNTKFNGTLTATPGDGIITLSGNFGITTSVTFNSTTFAVASFVAPYQGSISYAFDIASSGGFDAAGNLKGVTDTVTGTWAYGYDTLNRLTKGVAATGSYKGQSGCWAYDGWGNRLAESYSTGACPSAETTLTATAGYNTSNQLLWTAPNAGLSFTYDQAGNVLYDGVNHYVYDAEGRLCAVQALAGMTGYLYDAGGTRVTKGTITSLSCNLASNGFVPNTNYELGLGGEQISELSVSGTSPNYVSTWTHSNIFAGGKLLATYRGTDTYFPFSDWLGTKRVEITPDKQESSTFSLAYGNQLSVGGSAPDATEQHFTGKERDAESGLDYFKYRMYASSMGRWTSPDPGWFLEFNLANPQSLNMYAYVHNNPLSFVDPLGLQAAPTATCSSLLCWLKHLFHGGGGPTPSPAPKPAPAPAPTPAPTPGPAPMPNPTAVWGGNHVNYTYPDGSVVTRTGTHPWRDNNPGDLTGGHGSIGRDAGGGNVMAIYPSESAGWNALTATLLGKYGNQSIGATMNAFAPASDGNDPVQYAADLAAAVGRPLGTTMSQLSPSELTTVEVQIANHEGFFDAHNRLTYTAPH